MIAGHKVLCAPKGDDLGIFLLLVTTPLWMISSGIGRSFGEMGAKVWLCNCLSRLIGIMPGTGEVSISRTCPKLAAH